MRSRKSAEMRQYALRIAGTSLLALVTFFFARGAVHMYARYREASEGHMGAQAQLKDLQDRETALVDLTKKLSTDRGVEEELRRRYGVAKEGEGVIDIVPATNTSPVEPEHKGVIDWITHLF